MREGPLNQLRRMARPDGFLYEDAHYLAADIAIDPSRASRWVPRPLRLAGRTATLFTAWFPHNTFGSVYREAGVLLPVRHRLSRAVHCPWMIVDDDVALILGRELLGYPKKLGEIEWSLRDDRIEATATRRGETIVRMRGTLGAVAPDPPPILGRPHRNVRASLGLAVPWIVAFTPREKIVEVRRAELHVDIGGSDRDPLHELGFGEVVAARLHRVHLAAGMPPIPVGVASPMSHLRTVLHRVL